jgi:hypothetical protein
VITDLRYVAVMVEKLDDGVKAWQDLLGLEPINQPSVTSGDQGADAGQGWAGGGGGHGACGRMRPGALMEERKNRNPRQGTTCSMKWMTWSDAARSRRGGRVTGGEHGTAWVHR